MELLQKHFDIALETPDGIKKLRELILILATQGKLVPQDPNDQPACELLKQIEAEKNQTIKEKKIQKHELMSQKPETLQYDLPNGWEWVKLADMGEINPRNTFDEEKEAGFVSMSSISAQWGVQHKCESRKWSEIKKGYTHFANGDVVLAKITPCFENGKSCVIKGLPNGIGAGTTELHVFRNTFNCIFPPYLLAYLKNPKFITSGKQKMTGTAGQKRVPVDYFAFNPFPLPPLAEQKRIVAKIDQLMLLCDQLELQRNERTQKIIQVNTAAINRLLTVADKVSFNTSWPFIIQHFSELYSVTENVTELKKAILQLAMMGKLVSQDPKDQPAQELLREILIEKNRLIKEGKIQRQSPLPQIHPTSIPFDVPKGWEWTKIDDIAYVIQGQSPPSSTYNESRDGLPFYQGKLEFGKLFPTPRKWCSSPSKISEKGDVLISVRAPVGPTNICMETSCIGRGLAAVRGLGGIETLFMLYLFRTFEQKLSGQGTGTTFNAITGDKLRGFVIPVPPLAEQKRIVSKIETLIELCDSLDRQLRIATMKRTAIYDAVLAKV